MSLIDLFFPRGVKCIFCGRETREFGICDECLKTIKFISDPHCKKCGGEVSGTSKVCIECKGREFEFENNIAVFVYEGDARDKIISFKQNGYKYIGDAFSCLIYRKYVDSGLDEIIDIIIPMPINKNRLKERGFNQSEVLCNELLYTGKVDTNILRRVKDTPHQTGLSRENREKNLAGCFEVADKKKVRDKRILVIDDIYTTGSTFNECARTLIKAGASKVYTMSIARAPIKKDNIIV